MATLRPLVQQMTHGFYGWRVLMLMWGPRGGGAGTIQFGSALFVLPLEASLGISRGLISTIFSLGLTFGNVTAPVSGLLIDRFGARKVLLGSIVSVVVGFLLLAAATNVPLVALAFVGFISLGHMTVSYQASSVILNNWFDKYKATAMSLMQVGPALGSLIIVPLLAYTIVTWNWRAAAVLAALLVAITGLPAVLFSRNTPEEMGYQPDGVGGRRAMAAAPTPRAHLSGITFTQATGTGVLWMLIAAAAAFSATLTTIQIQFVAILAWKGVEEVGAAWMLSMWGVLSVPIVVVAGWIGDRVGRLKVGAVLVLLLGVGVLILNVGNTVGLFWLATLLMSGSQGIYPLMWAAVGETFGRRAFGTIRGVVSGSQAAGSLGMPMLAGFIFDWTGAYTLALWIIVGFAGLSATLLLLTPRRRYTGLPPTVENVAAPVRPRT